MKRVAILGTGLIGASIGLALKGLGEDLVIAGWDSNPAELMQAVKTGAIDIALESREAVLTGWSADIYVLAVPVLAILDWMEKLSPVCGEYQLVTDVGSTKLQICMKAAELFNGTGQGRFLRDIRWRGKKQGEPRGATASSFEEPPGCLRPWLRWVRSKAPGGTGWNVWVR